MNSHLLANRANPDQPSALTGMFPEDPDARAISFAAGCPNQRYFPVTAMRRALNHAIDTQQNELFQYPSVVGNQQLRDKLATRMAIRANVTTTADQILLTVGGQQGIDLVAKALLNPGDGVVVEAPAYVGALAAFDLYGPRYYDVPLQADGLDLTRLETVVKHHPNVKLLYTVPDYHNPTGITMSVAKRQALVDLANRYDFVILEDSPYRDLGYDRATPLPAIKSFDTNGRVVFLSSFSKILMPALRTGWLVADGELYDAIVKVRMGSDLASNGIIHAGIDAYLDANVIDHHIRDLTGHYRAQRDAMVTALRDYLPADTTFTSPAGGFFDWVTLPTNVNAATILTSTVIPRAHVSYVPATNFYPGRDVHNAFRLSFSNADPATITTGVHRLGDALKVALHASNPVH